MARASRSALVGAERPTWAYFSRARLMYMSTVCGETFILLATDDFDIDWNHRSSAVRSCWDSWGWWGRRSLASAPAAVGVTYGRSVVTASTASTRCWRP